MSAITPNTTLAVSGWTDQAGGSTNMHGPLADEDEDTWIKSPAVPTGEIVKVGLTDPATMGAGDVYFWIDAIQAP